MNKKDGSQMATVFDEARNRSFTRRLDAGRWDLPNSLF
jgi:hypothetical protein